MEALRSKKLYSSLKQFTVSLLCVANMLLVGCDKLKDNKPTFIEHVVIDPGTILCDGKVQVLEEGPDGYKMVNGEKILQWNPAEGRFSCPGSDKFYAYTDGNWTNNPNNQGRATVWIK